MYELLNIRNKFKGKRLYYCSFRDNLYSSTPVLRRVFIRLVTYIDEDMLLVGESFRLRIPMKALVTNRTFSMRVGIKQELDFDGIIYPNTKPWRIISTEKQEVARFIKEYYCTSLHVAWSDTYSNTSRQDKYKKLMEQLKKL
jgi:hypothetical protein